MRLQDVLPEFVDAVAAGKTDIYNAFNLKYAVVEVSSRLLA